MVIVKSVLPRITLQPLPSLEMTEIERSQGEEVAGDAEAMMMLMISQGVERELEMVTARNQGVD